MADVAEVSAQEPLAPSDEALWRCVSATLLNTLLPFITDPWARTSAIQLAGLAEDAAGRLRSAPTVVSERDASLIQAYRGALPASNTVFSNGVIAGGPEWIARLQEWLRSRLPSATVVATKRIATGNSRAMWLVQLANNKPLVLRIEQGGVFGSDGTIEAQRMVHLADLGLPVAPIIGIEETGSVLGNPFFVMEFIDSAVADGEDRSLPGPVAADFVQRLHQLHLVPAPAGWGPVDMSEACLAQIDRWDNLHRQSVDRPIAELERGADWLRRNLAASGPATVVHGDPGPGNFLHDGTRLIAFTDWEFVHGGHPAEDWAFLIRMRGARTMSEAQWLQLIHRETGTELDAATLRYWSVFNFFKGACANLTCLAAFEGPNPAPNMAIIGTALQRRFQNEMTALID